jgi:hypothetical protein
VAGNYSYVAAGEAGLRIIDTSDPASPAEVGNHDLPGIALSVAILGSRAYVCAREAGLRIIDISDPANPGEIGFYDTPGSASGVALAGSFAYVADTERGLRIIDVSDPARSREISFYERRGSPEEAARVENIMLGIFTLAGAIAALFLHALTWRTRLSRLPVAVRLGVVGAVGTILYSGISLLLYFFGPSGGADAFYLMRYVFVLFWILALLAILLIGLLQARSLPAPGWKGVLSAFYETGLGFLVVAGVNYALQSLLPTPDTGLSDRVYLARFIVTFVFALAALAVIRPIVRMNAGER